jgi:hypothetical protein
VCLHVGIEMIDENKEKKMERETKDNIRRYELL